MFIEKLLTQEGLKSHMQRRSCAQMVVILVTSYLSSVRAAAAAAESRLKNPPSSLKSFPADE